MGGETKQTADTGAVLEQVIDVLYDREAGDWRELQSCADAVQELSIILDPVIQAPRAAPAPATVWIVYEEWERGGDGGHACIVSVHATKQEAEDVQEATIVGLLKDGFQVWGWEWDEDDEADWEVDVHVEAQEVISHGRL